MCANTFFHEDAAQSSLRDTVASGLTVLLAAAPAWFWLSVIADAVPDAGGWSAAIAQNVGAVGVGLLWIGIAVMLFTGVES